MPPLVPRRVDHRPDQLDHLAALPSSERLRLISDGRFSHRQLNRWACERPDEVPLVNGELPWIALGLADLD